MDTKKPVRLGVWGCGGHAVNHLEHLPPQDLVTVTALCDLDLHRLLLAEQSINVRQSGEIFKIYNNPARLLSDPNVDAIFIATPDQYHTEQIMQALKAGKHVLAEKPLAINPEQFKHLYDAAAYAHDKGLVFLTCHPRRFDSRNVWIKQNLEYLERKYGSTNAVTFSFAYPQPKDAWKEGRGLLMDHVNHEVDLMQYLFGPEHISAVRICDSSHEYDVLGQRHDGIFFHFSGTRNATVKDWGSSHETLRIVLERAIIEVTGNEAVVSVRDSRGSLLEVNQVAGTLENPFDRYNRVVQNFGEVIRGEAEPYVGTSEILINTIAGVELTDRGIIDESSINSYGRYMNLA
jgi:predicted dehydrogenase